MNSKVKVTLVGLSSLSLILVGGIGTASANVSSQSAVTSSLANHQAVLQWAEANGVLNEFSTPNTSNAAMSSVAPNTSIGGGGGYQAYYPLVVKDVYGNTVPVEPGDILVTNDTQAGSGLTGHAAIVVDTEGDTASIEGSNTNPSFGTVSSFFSTHNNQVDIMSNKNGEGQSAANWAVNYVNTHPTTPYGIAYSSLYATGPNDETYCSKISYDSYYYGANDHTIYHSTYICTPYDLANMAQNPNMYREWTGFN